MSRPILNIVDERVVLTLTVQDNAAKAAASSAAEAAASEVQTGLDAVATGEDRVQTGLDRIATAADRVQTGLDRIATGEDATLSETARDEIVAKVDFTGAIENDLLQANGAGLFEAVSQEIVGQKLTPSILDNFFDEDVILFNSRIIAETPTLERNLRFVQDDLDTVQQKGLLTLIPSAYQVGSLWSINPSDGTKDFNVVRNSGVGTRVNKNGLIESVPAHVPRFEFDPITGEFLGLLVEPEGTNLFLNSDPFDDPGQGTRTAITFAANNWGIGLHGKVVFGNNSVTRRYSNSVSLTVGATASFSFIVKPNNGLTPSFGTGSSNIAVVTLGNLGSLPTFITIESIANGLFFVTGEIVNTATIQLPFGVIKTTGNNSIPFEISAIMFVLGSVTLKLSSYIPTTGTTVTRPADIITVTVPAGVSQAVYLLNGVKVTESITPGDLFQIPNGLIKTLSMI